MNLSIEQRLREFERTGEFSIILDLDKTPFEDFDHELIEGRVLMQYRSGHRPEGMSCYQFGMAWILDNFHPGIVAYFDSIASLEGVEGGKFYDGVLDTLHIKLSAAGISYSQLLKPHKDKDIFSAVGVIEGILEKQGYIFATGYFHGEVYTIVEGRVVLVEDDSNQLKKLWKVGEVEEWYEENKGKRYNISNTNILEQQVQSGSVDARILRTSFFGRRQLEQTFSEIEDLRKIV
jgi:hypothetical protein